MKFSDLVGMAAAAAFAVSLGAAPVMAKGPKAKPTVAKPKAPKAPSGSMAGAKAKSPAPKAKATAPKAKTNGSASAKSSGAQKPSAPSRKGTEGTPQLSASDPNATTPAEPTSTLPLSKAQEKLAKNPNLLAKMQARLPDGMDVMQAASGFRNLGQFVAAVNVSNNQGIEFMLLKRLMVGNEQLSLGQAIQRAKAMDAGTATTVATTALSQADAEIAASPSATTTTSTKKPKPRN